MGMVQVARAQFEPTLVPAREVAWDACSAASAGEWRACDCVVASWDSELWGGDPIQVGDYVGETCLNPEWVADGSPGAPSSLLRAVERIAQQVTERKGLVIADDHLVSQEEGDEILPPWWFVSLDEGSWVLVDCSEGGCFELAILVGASAPIGAWLTFVDEDDTLDLVVVAGGGDVWYLAEPVEPGAKIVLPDAWK